LRSRREIKTREQLRLQSDLRDLESEMKQLLKTLKQTVIETSQLEDTKQQLEETIKEVTACEMENMEASGALETDEIKLERLRKDSSSSSKISTTLRHEDLQSLHRDLSENVKELNLELNQMIDRVNFLESRLRETRREIQDRRSNYDTKLNVLERSENELKLRLEEMKASKIRLAVDIRSEETRISSQRRQITDVRRREDRLNEDLERLRESQQHVEISLQDSIDIHTVLKSKLETSTKEFETLCMRVRNSEREIEIAERKLSMLKLSMLERENIALSLFLSLSRPSHTHTRIYTQNIYNTRSSLFA
jgi:chromosome segregation ATPase